MIEPKGKGFCSTPSKVADLMIVNGIYHCNNKNLDMAILEPSCGEGVIVQRLLARGMKNITAIEMYPIRKFSLFELQRAYVHFSQCDFLEANFAYLFDFIIMNPPFDNALVHIEKAISLLNPGGVLVSLVPESESLLEIRSRIVFEHHLGNAICDYDVAVKMIGLK